MSKNKPSPEVMEQTREMAALLQETETVPIHQIRRIIQICGIDFARDVYKSTAEIEDQGGMMLPNNSRRRTRGGVFFHLARLRLTVEQRQLIFPGYRNAKGAPPKAPLGIPLMVWKQRIDIIHALQLEQGEVRTMKIVLVGRPGSVEKRPEVVVTTMSFVPSVPNLPRGIPTPPTTPTVCTVYMAPKQWEKIEATMSDPADTMTVEGICTIDTDSNTLAVFAASVRSELMDARMREEQKSAAAQIKAAKVAASKGQMPAADDASTSAKVKTEQSQAAAKPARKSRIADLKPEVAVAAPVVLNPNLPPDVSRKLNELYASASLFRQKVANIQAKPSGQQFGLEMTQKLLKNVEDEIATLEKKYNV